MKTVPMLLALFVSAGGSVLLAAEKKAPSSAQLAQRQKMTACNAEAGRRDLHGEPRRQFMRLCLRGQAAPAEHSQPAPICVEQIGPGQKLLHVCRDD